MAAEAPFSLADLEPEARALAEEAAHAAGLSVEEWITRAILRKTSSDAPAHASEARETPASRPAGPAPAVPLGTAREPPPSTVTEKELLAALKALAAEESPAAVPADMVLSSEERPSGLRSHLRSKELEELKRALDRIGVMPQAVAERPVQPLPEHAPPPPQPHEPVGSELLLSGSAPGTPESASAPFAASPAAPVTLSADADAKLVPDAVELDKPLAATEHATGMFEGRQAEKNPAAASSSYSALRREQELLLEEADRQRRRSLVRNFVIAAVLLAVLVVAAGLYLSSTRSNGTAAGASGWLGRAADAIQSIWQGTKKEPSTTNESPKPSSEAAPAQNAQPEMAQPPAAPSPQQAPQQQSAAPPPASAAPAPTAPGTTLSPSPSSIPAPPAAPTQPSPRAGTPSQGASTPVPPIKATPSTPAPAPSGENAAQPALPSEAKPSLNPAEPAPLGPVEVQQIMARAKRNDALAEHDLAILYARGDKIPQDFRKAAYWFRESALQGIADSQYNLGVLYERGLGVQKDAGEALLWYLGAAEQGYPAAQYNAGVAYAEGNGIPRNYIEARKWFQKAATLGLARASYNLGVLNELGLGGSVDLAEAYKWYRLALRGGESDSQTRLDDLAKKMNPQQIAEADRRYDAAAAVIPTTPAPFTTKGSEKQTGKPPPAPDR